MEQGIKGRQILALQGPFSTEMNAAILKQYDIHHMVTKNSGRTGGYQEKLEAAKILDPGVCDTACQEGCRYVFFCGNLWKTGTAL